MIDSFKTQILSEKTLELGGRLYVKTKILRDICWRKYFVYFMLFFQAAYYWYANVHTRSETFGSTLKAINGALECEGGSHGENRYLRFIHYKDILTRLGEPLPGDDDGWCTAW